MALSTRMRSWHRGHERTSLAYVRRRRVAQSSLGDVATSRPPSNRCQWAIGSTFGGRSVSSRGTKSFEVSKRAADDEHAAIVDSSAVPPGAIVLTRVGREIAGPVCAQVSVLETRPLSVLCAST